MTRRRIDAALDSIRNPSEAARARAAAAISVAATGLFLLLAYVQSWDFILRYQDEHSYMIQFKMLAHGRLWMPAIPPEIADFFSSYALLTSPRYGSIYFPGTALMEVAGVWLHLPFWAIPVMAAGACVGLMYRIVSELIDGVAGALGALTIASLPTFRSVAVMVLSQTPMLLLGLLLIWAWLRWRRERRPAWALAIGALGGWALVTRPLDAIAYVAPIGWAMLADIPTIIGRTRAVLACVMVAAAPFLILQGIQNLGMTGKLTQTPEARFAAEQFPAPMIGFHHIDWNAVPLPKLAEDRELLATSTWPAYRAHELRNIPSEWWKERLPRTLLVSLPNPLAAVLIPLGFLGLVDRRRRLLALILFAFLGLYACSVWYQQHYVMVIVPSIVMLMLLGTRQIQMIWPRAAVPITLVLAAMGLGALMETDANNWSPWLDLVRIENNLAALPPEPAVVLFRYHPFNPSVNVAYHEPVYNTDTLWPDDARIIRAHDLGVQNYRLFQYYARTQPGRMIYLYDRDGDTLTRLGTAAEAARSYNETMRSTNHGR